MAEQHISTGWYSTVGRIKEVINPYKSKMEQAVNELGRGQKQESTKYT